MLSGIQRLHKLKEECELEGKSIKNEGCPDQKLDSVVLTIDTDDLDYLRSPEALKFVENRIRQTLRLPPFQQELPLEAQAD